MAGGSARSVRRRARYRNRHAQRLSRLLSLARCHRPVLRTEDDFVAHVPKN